MPAGRLASSPSHDFHCLVRTTGIEPVRASPRDFKSLVSTSSTTSALRRYKHLAEDSSSYNRQLAPNWHRIGTEGSDYCSAPVLDNMAFSIAAAAPASDFSK